MNKDGGIILAYVDDLVLITRTVDQMAALKALIFSKFKCHDLGPISHYLGIRARRDRTRRAIELSMETYIDKLAVDLNRNTAAARATPMDVAALKLKLRSKDDASKLPPFIRNCILVGGGPCVDSKKNDRLRTVLCSLYIMSEGV
jgi:hypothetical protein